MTHAFITDDLQQFAPFSKNNHAAAIEAVSNWLAAGYDTRIVKSVEGVPEGYVEAT